ncbi:MAG: winged helix-turn-helix domain-containing protein [Thermoanaerobaculia bacterium]|nr:winged helix-turn-helix domain-containing protein [Thermoanaerobaculia bacterium]
MDDEPLSRRLECSEFRIAGWRVEPRLGRITRDGASIRLEPRVMEVLLLLAEQPGQVLSRRALLEAAWPDVVVGDDALSLAVSKLRRAFSDDRREPKYIETIPKTGYRLIAEVTELDAGIHDAPNPTSLQSPSPGAGWWRWGAMALVALGILGLASAALVRPKPPNRVETQALLPSQLTSLPGREQHAALSPEGDRVAFSWVDAEEQNADIYVQAIEAGSAMRLTDNPAPELGPTWSSDGQHIAFLRYTPEGCTIVVAASGGGDERQLAACGPNPSADLAWSPDGRWLAFPNRDSPDGPSSLYLLSVEGGTKRRLTAPPVDLDGDHDPAFSPDGTQISFVRSRSRGQGELFVVPFEGGDAVQRTYDDRWIAGHA